MIKNLGLETGVSKLGGKTRKLNPIIARLNRIEGQIRGVKKLYEKDPCDAVSIVTQVQAVRAALGMVAEMVLADEANRCVDEGDVEKLEEIVKTTFKTI